MPKGGNIKSRPFNFEVEDLLIQFAAAFDDVVIGRFNNVRDERDRIHVKYVFSPKQRVLYDIINDAETIQLPVIAMTLGNIKRDNDRAFNKQSGLYYNNPRNDRDPIPTSTYIKMPVPIDITVNMSIMSRYMTDLMQILSNFVPFSNPYVVLSWRIPDEFQERFGPEMRAQVMWDENVSINYPEQLQASDKARTIADTSFVIKGWLFANEQDPVGNIYKITSNFYAECDLDIMNSEGFPQLSGRDYIYEDSPELYPQCETVVISGNPWISNIFYNGIHLDDSDITLCNSVTGGQVTLYGDQYDYTDYIMLSSDVLSANTTEVSGFSGTLIEDYDVISNNIISFTLPQFDDQSVQIIVFNEAGHWTSGKTITISEC